MGSALAGLTSRQMVMRRQATREEVMIKVMKKVNNEKGTQE